MLDITTETGLIEALLAVALPYNPGGQNACTEGAACAGAAWVPANERTGFDGCQTGANGYWARCAFHQNVKECA